MRSRDSSKAAEMRSRSAREVPAFILVGGVAAALYILLATGLDAGLGLRPVFASIVAHATVVPFAYSAQRSITFRSASRHAIAFPRYLVTQGLSLAVAALVSAVASPIGVPWVFMLAAAMAATCSFLLLKHWGFAERRLTGDRR